jgi:hypothetical protein
MTHNHGFDPPLGELKELLVDGGVGEPIRQRRHNVGADTKNHLERVLLGVTVGEERAQRRLADVTSGVKQPQRELPDRVQPGLRQRLVCSVNTETSDNMKDNILV